MISLSICGIFVLGVMFFISDLYLKYWDITIYNL